MKQSQAAASDAPGGRWSRRAALAGGGAGLAAAALGARRGGTRAAAQEATPVGAASTPEATMAMDLPPEILAVMAKPRYPAFAQWGLHVADLETGEPVYDLNGVQRFVPGSTTKLFPAAASLDAYGPDFRFETPVYRQGEVDGDVLRGDLILVASGDITLGGRDQADGTMAYSNIDHTDANAVPGFATLTPTDPLAGLDALAEQVAATGVVRVRGDVVVDARLWDAMPKDDYILSPIMVNDNVVDLTITSGRVGQAATVQMRPETAFYDLRADVRTVDGDGNGGPQVTIAAAAPNAIVVQGQIPAESTPFLQTFQVADPPAFARALFIEALARQGVTVEAKFVAPNPVDRLPAAGAYAAADRVALFRSLPFAETIKVILKVSMNRGADTLVFLLAVKEGKQTFDDGLQAIRPFLERLGVEAGAVSLADGRGNERADLFSPRSVAALLLGMARSANAAPYEAALPILGVDGTEWQSLPASSPARGKVVAKSGTTVDGDLMNQEFLLLGKGDAGYLTAQSGRRFVWAVFVNDVLSDDLNELLGVGADFGTIAEAIYERN